MHKKKIEVWEYAQQILEALPHGVLLNTKAETLNSMVIGWGSLGIEWSKPIFTVYVREHRYSRQQLDQNGEFTISLPMGAQDPEITKICGTCSGRDMNKIDKAGLTPVESNKISVPGMAQYPLTLECRVLQKETQDLSTLDASCQRHYPKDVDGYHTGANQDAHVAYIAEIVDAYVIIE